MEVEAFSRKISNVLSKGKFTITNYQREFDWADEKLNELIDELYESVWK